MKNKGIWLTISLSFLFTFGFATGCGNSDDGHDSESYNQEISDSGDSESYYNQESSDSESKESSFESSQVWQKTLAFSSEGSDATIDFNESEFKWTGATVDGYFEYGYTFVGGCETYGDGGYVFYPESAEYTVKYFDSVIEEERIELGKETTDDFLIHLRKYDDVFYVVSYGVGDSERFIGLAGDIRELMLRGGEVLVPLNRIELELNYGMTGYDMAFPINMPKEDVWENFMLVVVRIAAPYIHVYELSELEAEMKVDTSNLGNTTMEITYRGNTYEFSCYVYSYDEFGGGGIYFNAKPRETLAPYVEIGTTAEEYLGDTAWIISDPETGEDLVYDGEYTVLDWDSTVTQPYMQYVVHFLYDGNDMYYLGSVNVCKAEEKDNAYTFSSVIVEGAVYQDEDVIYMPEGTDVSALSVDVKYETYGGEYVFKEDCDVSVKTQDWKNRDIYVVEISCADYSEERVVHVLSNSEEKFPLEVFVTGAYFDETGSLCWNYAEAYVRINYSDGSKLELSADKSIEKLKNWINGNTTPTERLHVGRSWDRLMCYWDGSACGYYGVYGYFYLY